MAFLNNKKLQVRRQFKKPNWQICPCMRTYLFYNITHNIITIKMSTLKTVLYSMIGLLKS